MTHEHAEETVFSDFSAIGPLATKLLIRVPHENEFLPAGLVEDQRLEEMKQGLQRHRANKIEHMQTLAFRDRMSYGWEYENPKLEIDELLARMPERVPHYPRLRGNELSRTPQPETFYLERYMLASAPNLRFPAVDEVPVGALAMVESIKCMHDSIRTKYFLQGIADAVDELEDQPGDTIRVFDAGCGAVPILAIYAALCSDKVQATALELNPQAVEVAREFVHAFGLSSRIEVIEGDATTFTPEQPIDLLVSETMHSALTNEPIVQILRNLQPYVREAGKTLPSAVIVKAAAVPVGDIQPANEYVQIYYANHPVVPNIRWQDVATYLPGMQLEEISFAINGSEIPPEGAYILVTSEVEVGTRTIEPYQSLITLPQTFRDADNQPIHIFPGSEEINVSYPPGQLLYALVEPPDHPLLRSNT